MNMRSSFLLFATSVLSSSLIYVNIAEGFELDFSTVADGIDATNEEDGGINVGDEVCITGYIINSSCMQLGNLLSESDIIPKNPDDSFHCLLDVDRFEDIGYDVLGEKRDDADTRCLGFRLDDAGITKTTRRATSRRGNIPHCSICSVDDAVPYRGYRATVKGTVKELGDGSIGISGTPILHDVEILDESIDCERPTIPPFCIDYGANSGPTLNPKAAVALHEKDCSREFCENALSADFLQRYRINIAEGTTTDECVGCTVSMELIYEGEAWIGIGFSQDGMMIGSEAVIGIPGSVPEKYILGGSSPSAVQPMAKEKQTLTNASVEFANGQTVMKFTKIMNEAGEIEIVTGDNIFLWAYGSSTALDYHAARASFVLNLSSGNSEEPAIADRKKWLAHGIVFFCAWGVFVPFAVQASLLRPLLPEGPIWFQLHRAFNTFSVVLFIVFFVFELATTKGGGHFTNKHQRMGLSMFIMSIFQVVGGVSRPHTPDSGEVKTHARKGWEIGHRLLGTSLLACGFWQMQDGIKLYSIKYSVDGSDRDKVLTAYWVWIGIMIAIMVIGGVFFKLKPKRVVVPKYNGFVAVL